MNIQKLIGDLEQLASDNEYLGQRRDAKLLKQAASSLKAAYSESALKRYTEVTTEEPIASALERLRFFCSIAMKNGQDWLDVEPFFADVEAELNTETEPEDRGVAGPDLDAYCPCCRKRGHYTTECWSTHGMNTPHAKEIDRLCRIANSTTNTPSTGNYLQPSYDNHGVKLVANPNVHPDRLVWVNPAPHAEPPLVPSPSITLQLKYGGTASIVAKPNKVLVSFTRDHPDHIWYKCTWPDGSHSECGDLARIESKAEAQGIEIEWVGETE